MRSMGGQPVGGPRHHGSLAIGGAKQLHRDAIIGRYGILTIDCKQPQLVPRSMVTGAPLSHLPRARAIDILQVACSLCLFFLLS